MVFIPFPTALLGEFFTTKSASPAVVLYNAVLALQSVGWILMGITALKNGLGHDEKPALTIAGNTGNGYFAFVFCALLAVPALWQPKPAAIITSASWIFWFVPGIRLKHS